MLNKHGKIITFEIGNIANLCIRANATLNRIPGYTLSSDFPENGLLSRENRKCIPSNQEQKLHRENYIVLV